MTPVVRPAQPADAAAVKACIDAAFRHYIVRIGQPPGPMRLDVAAAVAAGQVWLAEQGGEVVGALVQYDSEQGLYIDTVAVLPPCQGSGVGRALLLFAEQEAQRRGHRQVHLCTNAHMTENQVFYPRIGYVETGRGHEGGYDRVFYAKACVRG
ncbi:MAG: GNAT family N-acetyltransferase [Burkholderiaceae bacterium]|nr:GNAT family N-acetyltransferase [Burkholderiaceae bacterium]